MSYAPAQKKLYLVIMIMWKNIQKSSSWKTKKLLRKTLQIQETSTSQLLQKFSKEFW